MLSLFNMEVLESAVQTKQELFSNLTEGVEELEQLKCMF